MKQSKKYCKSSGSQQISGDLRGLFFWCDCSYQNLNYIHYIYKSEKNNN